MLDAIDKGRLRERAGETGDFLIGALEHLASTERGALIGRVSGSGLFVGVEFVSDRERRTPATQQTSLLCSRLKDLVSERRPRPSPLPALAAPPRPRSLSRCNRSPFVASPSPPTSDGLTTRRV